MAGMVGLIKHADLLKLRQIVRRVHLRHLPKDHLTDHECDRLIDSFSEEVVEANLRALGNVTVQ
jgi:hypothetical protein